MMKSHARCVSGITWFAYRVEQILGLELEVAGMI